MENNGSSAMDLGRKTDSERNNHTPQDHRLIGMIVVAVLTESLKIRVKLGLIADTEYLKLGLDGHGQKRFQIFYGQKIYLSIDRPNYCCTVLIPPTAVVDAYTAGHRTRNMRIATVQTKNGSLSAIRETAYPVTRRNNNRRVMCGPRTCLVYYATRCRRRGTLPRDDDDDDNNDDNVIPRGSRARRASRAHLQFGNVCRRRPYAPGVFFRPLQVRRAHRAPRTGGGGAHSVMEFRVSKLKMFNPIFSLTKQSYFACDSSAKKWYETVPKCVEPIHLKKCCNTLLSMTKKSINHSIPLDFTISATAASNGHMDCLVYARSLGFQWDSKTCKNAASNGHLNILKYAHENSCPWDKTTCTAAAKYGHLDILSYAHENGCPWDKNTCSSAALHGHVSILKYAHEHGCPWDEQTCRWAAKGGRLLTLKYAHENGCPWNVKTCKSAARNGYLKTLKYAHKHGCPWDVSTTIMAARNGDLKMLKYAHENGCPWNERVCSEAAGSGNLNVLKYAHKNNCPWDDSTCISAAQSRNRDAYNYALKNGCPLFGPIDVEETIESFRAYCSTVVFERYV
ncbi:Ankyrin repeat-containing domain [Cinara cedri]|uniref:Ankyrin repeat-containing domain n=1 Tax=Cinara cedri TaxID=506608 RepID=A0A5E4N6J8_9HEMI|nr:Ankyrin repeat-containing domain [Cinara cedri]